MSATYNPLGKTLARDHGKPHHFAIVDVVSGDGATPADDVIPSDDNAMERDASTVREDVERVLDHYLKLEYFSVGSAAGRMVIDESRVGRRRPRKTNEKPANIEERDALRIRELRRAIYAPVQVARVHNAKGELLIRVIAAKEIAPIVHGGASHGTAPASIDRRQQMWKATIAQKLARISRMCGLCMTRPADTPGGRCRHVPELLDAARLRIEIEKYRNIASQADRDLGSRTRRKRLGQAGVANATDRRATANNERQELVARRIKITRSTVYEEAINLFDLACSEDAETRAYCFRD